MKMYVFEGTPEELSQVAKTLHMSVPSAGSVVPTEELPVQEKSLANNERDEGNEGEDKGVTVKFARRALKRRELSDPLKAVLRRLYEANDWVGIKELCEVSKYTRPQFAGLMGAFGRRLSNTQGHDEEAYFFFFEWDDETRAWKYRLPDTVREALELESIV